jgi:hypothetical protein
LIADLRDISAMGCSAKISFKRKTQGREKETSPGNQTKQVSCSERSDRKVAIEERHWRRKLYAEKQKAESSKRFITMESLILAQDER